MHLHSVLDHLRASPLTADGWALFVTKDGFLSERGVADLIQRAGLPLRIEQSLTVAMKQLTERLQTASQQELWNLAGAWRKRIFEDAQLRLVPVLAKRVEGLNLPRGVSLIRVHAAKARWEYGADALAGPSKGEHPTYAASFEIRLDLVAEATRVPPGGVPDVIPLKVTLLISVYADLTPNMEKGTLSVVYRSAQAFCVIWKEREDLENLPQNVELLSTPV